MKHDTIELLLLDCIGAAKALSCSPRQIQKLAADGQLPYVKLGNRKLYFRKVDLESWLASKVQRAGGAA